MIFMVFLLGQVRAFCVPAAPKSRLCVKPLVQDGGAMRLMILSFVAFAAFLYQTGILAALFGRHVPANGAEPEPVADDAHEPDPRRPVRQVRAASTSPTLLGPPTPVAWQQIRVRTILSGGIAPGGGIVMDLGYVLITLVCSLFPWWDPVPAVEEI
jgi:hypothetical protein